MQTWGLHCCELLPAPHLLGMQVWDLSSHKVIRSYEGHGGGVNTVLFHPDGTCIASGSTDGSLKVRRLFWVARREQGVVLCVSVTMSNEHTRPGFGNSA